MQEARRASALASPALAVDVTTVKLPRMNPSGEALFSDQSTDPEIPNAKAAAANETCLRLNSFIEASVIMSQLCSSPGNGGTAKANLRRAPCSSHWPQDHCPKVQPKSVRPIGWVSSLIRVNAPSRKAQRLAPNIRSLIATAMS